MSRSVKALTTALLAWALLPLSGAAQGVQSLASGCALGGADPARCLELAVTARSLQSHLGLLAGFGSEVSGSAGTLGRRLGTTPHIAVEARFLFTKLALPDLADPGPEPSRRSTFIVPAMRGGLTFGVFDGFSVLPTVGGVLAIDLFTQGSVAFLPTGEGFDGKSSALTVGARLGLLRESFTLPGVSLSLSRRWVGGVTYGAVETGGGAVQVEPSVTSMRFTVGKDVLSVGVLAGVGWDRYSGNVTLLAAGDADVSQQDLSGFRNSRRLLFGGASMNFLVLQLSGELGWAQGFGTVDGYRNAPFDPTSGTWYVSLAFRLTI